MSRAIWYWKPGEPAPQVRASKGTEEMLHTLAHGLCNLGCMEPFTLELSLADFRRVLFPRPNILCWTQAQVDALPAVPRVTREEVEARQVLFGTVNGWAKLKVKP